MNVTLKTQYQNYLKENPTSKITYNEWLDFKIHEWTDVTWIPVVSDNFQIGPDGAFEYEDKDDLLN